MPLVTKLSKMVIYHNSTGPQNHVILYLHGFVKSSEKYFALYLYLQTIYEHQTKKSGDCKHVLWEASSHKVTWHFDHVINVRASNKLKKHISTFTRGLAGKFESVVA